MIAFLAAAVCTFTLAAELNDISHATRRVRHIPDYVTGALVRVSWMGGLKPGDIIQGVGSDLVQNVCDVRRTLEKHRCDENLRLTIRRGPDTMKIDVRTAAALRRTKSTCEDGNGAACTALAKKNGDDDVVLLRQACDLGDGEGCFMLGLKLGNTAEGADAYEQACDAGNPLACTNLGFILQNGKGRAADQDAAVRLYQRACDGTICSGRNELGCVNLARVYRDGIGVKADAQRAIALFRGVCERGDPENAENAARACSAAGTTSIWGKEVKPDIPTGLALLEKGCDGGDTMGCFNLGVLYEYGNEVKKDLARAAAYYKRSCDRGDSEACERRANTS